TGPFMNAFQSFSLVTSKTFVTHPPQLGCSCRCLSGSLAVLPPVTAAATPKSSTGVLYFHSHDANIVIEGFAFGKLTNVVNDAIEKFLRRKGGVTSNGSVQLLFREDRAESIFHFE